MRNFEKKDGAINYRLTIKEVSEPSPNKVGNSENSESNSVEMESYTETSEESSVQEDFRYRVAQYNDMGDSSFPNDPNFSAI